MNQSPQRSRNRKKKSNRKTKMDNTCEETKPNQQDDKPDMTLPKGLDKTSLSLGNLLNDIKTACKMSAGDSKTPFQIPFPTDEASELSLTPAETSFLEKLLSVSFTKPPAEDTIVTYCGQCQREAKLRCTGCKKMFYCDRDCQKTHWEKHQDLCRTFTVSKQLNGMRALVASRDIARDEVVLEEQALVVGPRPEAGPVCLGCYKRITDEYRCPKCSWPMCGLSCAASEAHRAECAVTSQARLTIDMEGNCNFYEFVMLIRCVVLESTNPKKWNEGTNRLNNKNRLIVGSTEYQHNRDVIIPALVNLFKIEKIGTNTYPQAIHKMLSLIQSNSLPVKSPYGEVQGIFPMGSLMSHSCVPNTRMEWNARSGVLAVKATEPIAKGDRITTILTDILWGTRARRDHLQLRGIDCQCRRCADPTELQTHFSALNCQKCTKRSPVLPANPRDAESVWRCKNCPYEIPSAEVLQMTLGLGNEVGNALADPSVVLLEEIHAKWLPYFHRNHYHFHAMKHSLLQLYGRSYNENQIQDQVFHEEMAKKEKACKDFLKICSFLDPTLANTLSFVGLTFYEHHKTILEKAKKEFAESVITAEQLKKRVLLSKALLRKSMDIFKNEKADTPEGQLYLTCQDESNAIGKWMVSVGLS